MQVLHMGPWPQAVMMASSGVSMQMQHSPASTAVSFPKSAAFSAFVRPAVVQGGDPDTRHGAIMTAQLQSLPNESLNLSNRVEHWTDVGHQRYPKSPYDTVHSDGCVVHTPCLSRDPAQVILAVHAWILLSVSGSLRGQYKPYTLHPDPYVPCTLQQLWPLIMKIASGTSGGAKWHRAHRLNSGSHVGRATHIQN